MSDSRSYNDGMLPERLEAVDEAFIQGLCTSACPESQRLDFKRALPPAGNDAARLELLKDVAAFANADGGDLVFGVSDDKGCAETVHAITSEAADAAQRRLRQMLDAKLERRVSALQFRDVPIAARGYVLVLRVPASFDGPHSFEHNGGRRFVHRTGTNITDMTYEQVRQAFDRGATAVERARQFRERRIEAIKAGKTWAPLRPGPLCVVHVVPLVAMSGRLRVDLNKLYHDYLAFRFRDWGGASRTLNLDGLAVHIGRRGSEHLPAYTQVFRDGSIEAARFGGLTIKDDKIIPGLTVARFFRDCVSQFLPALRAMGLSGPAIIGGALLNTEGYEFAYGDAYSGTARADRSDLVLPEVWIERLEAVTDIDSIARELLDILWQCFDQERCVHFDGSGAPSRELVS
jgi:hypothetical protein